MAQKEEMKVKKQALVNKLFAEFQNIELHALPSLRSMRKTFKATGFIFFLVSTVAVLGITVIQVTSLLATNRTISSAGYVKTNGIGVYWDDSLTNRVSTINWGLLEPGSNTNTTIYVHNEGNSAMILSLNTSNWSPSSASGYMSLTWNYVGQSVAVNQPVQVTLTLAVSPGIQGITTFGFDIMIMGTS